MNKKYSILILGLIVLLLGAGCTYINVASNEVILSSVASQETEDKLIEDEGVALMAGTLISEVQELFHSYVRANLQDEYLILVNKEVRLEDTYEPKTLVLPEVPFTKSSDKIVRVMEEKAAKALEELFEAARDDGIMLLANSGYRSYSIQKNLYERNLRIKGRAHTEKYSAQPGASEHQTGLAMDIVAENYQSLDEGFENTEAFKWLSENAYKYGYILRYLEGKEDITGYGYEPWHYRYVGQPYSEYITRNNLTFEEFLSKYQ
ncbi:M15 family metallopeptidase [Alloiococcus sp. CFN-8]|uniref:M15 family metallopeptidase n=1 Tax=Alloiococcus sp. CFN-8 TaxID=3416081 RepID=UPI003CF4A248